MLAFLIVFGLISLGGVWLTLRSIFPKRQGDTPFCRNCRYNLTGIDLESAQARCPECGALLATAGA